MKPRPPKRTRAAIDLPRQERPAGAVPARVHPVVIYPFCPREDYGDLAALYRYIGELAADPARYARPLTVIDRKTQAAAEGQAAFGDFQREVVARHSDVVAAWCVDTCQMWYTGLGLAADRGGPEDVYWLIPGDFNYGSPVGREVLGHLHDLPEIVLELQQDLCIGEIETAHDNSKHLIDTYGTFALLYTWFPAEAREIRQFTERPRSEFLALRHGFLHELLRQRWYAYEQTVVMLLQAVLTGKRISRFFVGNISDLLEGRESISSAIQQVERTERVLKSLWRERHQPRPTWLEDYRRLERQSEQVRHSALLILSHLLT